MRSPAHEPTRCVWGLRARLKPFRSQRSSGASGEATQRSPFPRPLSLARRMASAVKVAPPSANSRSFCPSPRRQGWRYCCLSRLTTGWYCPMDPPFLFCGRLLSRGLGLVAAGNTEQFAVVVMGEPRRRTADVAVAEAVASCAQGFVFGLGHDASFQTVTARNAPSFAVA